MIGEVKVKVTRTECFFREACTYFEERITHNSLINILTIYRQTYGLAGRLVLSNILIANIAWKAFSILIIDKVDVLRASKIPRL